jgi:hypothetical protein
MSILCNIGLHCDHKVEKLSPHEDRKHNGYEVTWWERWLVRCCRCARPDTYISRYSQAWPPDLERV